jgi:hypothetical protein
MSTFITHVVEDFRHGRETWRVLFLLSSVSLGVTLLLLNVIPR